jgi:hypothetical protein
VSAIRLKKVLETTMASMRPEDQSKETLIDLATFSKQEMVKAQNERDKAQKERDEARDERDLLKDERQAKEDTLEEEKDDWKCKAEEYEKEVNELRAQKERNELRAKTLEVEEGPIGCPVKMTPEDQKKKEDREAACLQKKAKDWELFQKSLFDGRVLGPVGPAAEVVAKDVMIETKETEQLKEDLRACKQREKGHLQKIGELEKEGGIDKLSWDLTELLSNTKASYESICACRDYQELVYVHVKTLRAGQFVRLKPGGEWPEMVGKLVRVHSVGQKGIKVETSFADKVLFHADGVEGLKSWPIVFVEPVEAEAADSSKKRKCE